jgi:hypothetical protein
MSFAAEVAQANASRGEAPPAAPVESAPAPEGLAMPEHGAVHPEQAAEAVQETVQPAPKQGKIKIGSQVFESPEEAIAYAEEMERTLLQKDAFDQGRLAAEPKPLAVEPEKDEFDDIESELFEKPKSAIQKIYNKAKEDAKKEMRSEDAKQAEIKNTWDGFYSSNSDLASQREVVDYVLQKNWNTLGHLPVEKSLKMLAEKTREFLGSTKLATLPTRELQSGPAIVPGASSAATTAPAKKESQALDFITQVNKLRRREVR